MIADAVADTVAADPAFQSAFRDGAARLHDALFGDPDADASMVVAGSGAMVRAELQAPAATELRRGSRTCRCSRSAPRGASARCGGWRRRRATPRCRSRSRWR